MYPEIQSNARGLLVVASLIASAGANGASVSLQIDAQPLESALKEFSRQSGVQLLFVSNEKLRQGISPSLSGSYQVADGLQQLLLPSGLNFQFVNSKTVAILDKPEDLLGRGAVQTGRSGAEPVKVYAEDPLTEEREEHGVGERGKSVLSHVAIPEVLVKGKKSLNTDIERTEDDILPYTVIGRDVIETSGATNVDELLRKNLSANTNITPSAVSGGEQGNTTSIDLRGLGTSQTLILVDGRPAAPIASGGNSSQPDLNSIPLAAIERIEVLPASASAIYGGRATGGVVNVVLRRDYSGVDTTLTYDNAFRSNASRSRVDLAGGFAFNGGRTSVMVSGSYTDQNPLLTGDRDFFSRGRATILQNNPSFYSNRNPPLGRTANIRSANNTNLTLKTGAPLNSTIAYVPNGYAGIASDAGAAFLQTAGRYNLDQAETAQAEGGTKESLYVSSISRSARGTLRHDFSSSVTAFLELAGSNNSSQFQRNSMTSTFRIPRTSTANPFNQDILVTTPTVGADETSAADLKTRSAAAGVIVKLPWRDWQLSSDYRKGETENAYIGSSAGIAPAGTAAATSGALVLLRDANVYPADFVQYQLSDAVLFPVKSTLGTASIRTGGAILDLPAGPAYLSVQIERRKEKLDDFEFLSTGGTSGSLYPERSQVVNSAYAETRVPVVGEGHTRWIQSLELQLAGRYDRYKSNAASQVIVSSNAPINPATFADNQFNSTVPSYGLKLVPIQDLMLRASYGEGFLPPNYTQMVPDVSVPISGGLVTLRDPRRGNQVITTPFTLLRGGNPDLQPERSFSRTVGVVVTPRFLQGLRLSWDWVRIQKKGNIAQLGLSQDTLDNELLVPGLITRGPPQNDGFDVGPVTEINARFINLSRAFVESFDWALEYRWTPANLGNITFSSRASQMIHNQIQATTLSATSERATTLNLPRWQANGSLSWEKSSFLVTWWTQYLGGSFYAANRLPVLEYGRAEAPSALYHDISISYKVTNGLGGIGSLFSETEFIFGAKNVFNTPPRLQLDTSSGQFDPRVDPRLRSYFISAKKSF